jgi:hypothetical protein
MARRVGGQNHLRMRHARLVVTESLTHTDVAYARRSALSGRWDENDRRGMFEREHELVAALARQHRSLWPAAQERRVRAERGYGAGVADLVVLDLVEAAIERRLHALPPLTHSSEAFVLSRIKSAGPTRAIDVSAVVRRFSDRTTKKLVDRLCSAGYLERDGGVVQTHTDITPVVARLVAVEAKLTDWRGAMEQALRYRAFANQTYVALPLALAERIEPTEREHFRLWRMGLIGVTEYSARILIGCRRTSPGHADMRFWAEEVELSDRVGMIPRVVSPFTARFAVPTPEELVAGVA